MRDFRAGPVEKMKMLVQERKTKVLALFEKEITVGRKKKSQRLFLHSCNDPEGTSEIPMLPSPSQV